MFKRKHQHSLWMKGFLQEEKNWNIAAHTISSNTERLSDRHFYSVMKWLKSDIAFDCGLHGEDSSVIIGRSDYLEMQRKRRSDGL